MVAGRGDGSLCPREPLPRRVPRQPPTARGSWAAELVRRADLLAERGDTPDRKLAWELAAESLYAEDYSEGADEWLRAPRTRLGDGL